MDMFRRIFSNKKDNYELLLRKAESRLGYYETKLWKDLKSYEDISVKHEKDIEEIREKCEATLLKMYAWAFYDLLPMFYTQSALRMKRARLQVVLDMAMIQAINQYILSTQAWRRQVLSLADERLAAATAGHPLPLPTMDSSIKDTKHIDLEGLLPLNLNTFCMTTEDIVDSFPAVRKLNRRISKISEAIASYDSDIVAIYPNLKDLPKNIRTVSLQDLIQRESEGELADSVAKGEIIDLIETLNDNLKELRKKSETNLYVPELHPCAPWFFYVLRAKNELTLIQQQQRQFTTASSTNNSNTGDINTSSSSSVGTTLFAPHLAVDKGNPAYESGVSSAQQQQFQSILSKTITAPIGTPSKVPESSNNAKEDTPTDASSLLPPPRLVIPAQSTYNAPFDSQTLLASPLETAAADVEDETVAVPRSLSNPSTVPLDNNPSSTNSNTLTAPTTSSASSANAVLSGNEPVGTGIFGMLSSLLFFGYPIDPSNPSSLPSLYRNIILPVELRIDFLALSKALDAGLARQRLQSTRSSKFARLVGDQRTKEGRLLQIWLQKNLATGIQGKYAYDLPRFMQFDPGSEWASEIRLSLGIRIGADDEPSPALVLADDIDSNSSTVAAFFQSSVNNPTNNAINNSTTNSNNRTSNMYGVSSRNLTPNTNNASVLSPSQTPTVPPTTTVSAPIVTATGRAPGAMPNPRALFAFLGHLTRELAENYGLANVANDKNTAEDRNTIRLLRILVNRLVHVRIHAHVFAGVDVVPYSSTDRKHQNETKNKRRSFRRKDSSADSTVTKTAISNTTNSTTTVASASTNLTTSTLSGNQGTLTSPTPFTLNSPNVTSTGNSTDLSNNGSNTNLYVPTQWLEPQRPPGCAAEVAMKGDRIWSKKRPLVETFLPSDIGLNPLFLSPLPFERETIIPFQPLPTATKAASSNTNTAVLPSSTPNPSALRSLLANSKPSTPSNAPVIIPPLAYTIPGALLAALDILVSPTEMLDYVNAAFQAVTAEANARARAGINYQQMMDEKNTTEGTGNNDGTAVKAKKMKEVPPVTTDDFLALLSFASSHSNWRRPHAALLMMWRVGIRPGDYSSEDSYRLTTLQSAVTFICKARPPVSSVVVQPPPVPGFAPGSLILSSSVLTNGIMGNARNNVMSVNATRNRAGTLTNSNINSTSNVSSSSSSSSSTAPIAITRKTNEGSNGTPNSAANDSVVMGSYIDVAIMPKAPPSSSRNLAVPVTNGATGGNSSGGTNARGSSTTNSSTLIAEGDTEYDIYARALGMLDSNGTNNNNNGSHRSLISRSSSHKRTFPDTIAATTMESGTTGNENETVTDNIKDSIPVDDPNINGNENNNNMNELVDDNNYYDEEEEDDEDYEEISDGENDFIPNDHGTTASDAHPGTTLHDSHLHSLRNLIADQDRIEGAINMFG